MKYLSLKIATTICALVALTLLLTGCFCPHRYEPCAEPEPLPPFYVPEKIRVALVLGSGGVRGMAHVGVLKEFEEAGIPIDLIVGCSAGSIVGALYADNPCSDVIKNTVARIRTDSVLNIDIWNCRYGLSQGRTLRYVLDQDLQAETFEELKIPLVVVATDLHSGELVPMGGGDLVKAVQSSCTLPLIFVPCEHMGRIMVDGGTINPVPVRVAQDLGADVVICVDLSELLTKTFPTNLFEVATRSAEIAFMWQNESCTHSADVVIRPKTCDIGTFNDDMKWVLYEAGRRAAREQMPRIREVIASIAAADWECNDWHLVSLDPYTPQIYHAD